MLEPVEECEQGRGEQESPPDVVGISGIRFFYFVMGFIKKKGGVWVLCFPCCVGKELRHTYPQKNTKVLSPQKV